MSIFLSSKEVAQQVATQMQEAIQQLEKTFDPNTDNQTTIMGNIEGHKLNDTQKTVIDSFISAFQKDVANIQSVAEEFEAVDDKIKTSFSKIFS